MIKQIVGGIATLVIGGTAYTVSQSNVVDNFSKDTGMSHQQAQDYVKNAQNNLDSFSKIGQDFVSDGNSVLSSASQIDCVNNTYTWETSDLTCTAGLTGVQAIGNDEVTLGNCYISLDTNLGDSSQSQISQCITDIDTVDSDYDLPIAAKILDAGQVTDLQNTNRYNKSVLQAALQSK